MTHISRLGNFAKSFVMRQFVILFSLFTFFLIILSNEGCKKVSDDFFDELDSTLYTADSSLIIDSVLVDTSKVEEIESPIYTGQGMPSADLFTLHYPAYGKHLPGGGVTDAQLANLAGGLVKHNLDQGFWGNNTCALRLSHALNLSGAKIPKIIGQTSSAANADQYIFRVKTMRKYLLETYGEPSIVGSTKEEFLGHSGIVIFDTGNLWSDATGHATFFDGDRVLGGNYAHIEGYYFENAAQIMMWEAN